MKYSGSLVVVMYMYSRDTYCETSKTVNLIERSDIINLKADMHMNDRARNSILAIDKKRKENICQYIITPVSEMHSLFPCHTHATDCMPSY